MIDTTCSSSQSGFAAFLPDAARRYLAHTSEGRPIREIAREAGCHASTVLRQVRKTESMRDDPMVDKALNEASEAVEETECPDAVLAAVTDAVRHLCARGTMLLYNRDLPQPAIVQTVGEGETRLLGAITLDLAAALVMRQWVTEEGGAAVKRYRITSEGRAALPELVAARDRRALRRSEDALDAFSDLKPDRRSRDRSAHNGPGSDNPLVSLARRRGADGQPFLTPDFLAAGDRLHTDYQIAGFGRTELLGWSSPNELQPYRLRAAAMTDARHADAMTRTLDAITDLGPGLSDVALRCCCLREGLEATEKRMGWSARSGKVVLRIALQRLSLFYATSASDEGLLIG